MDQNGHFSQFCPFFELQWGLIFFYFTYSMPVGQKLLIEKIIENIFFMKINIFGIFGQKPSFRGPGTVPFSAKWLQQVQIQVFVRSIENLFCPKLLIEKFLEKDFFMKTDILAFLGQKLKKWAVRESGFFSILPIFFDRIKKYRKYKKIVSPNDQGMAKKISTFQNK